MDFEHVAEYRCFTGETVGKDHKPIFYFFHVVVGFAGYLYFEYLCNEFVVRIFDILVILVDDSIALDIFEQSIFW